MATIELDLTNLGLFSGLYEFMWLHSSTDDDELEYEWNNIQKDLGLSDDDMKMRLDIRISFKTYLEKIAEVYINYLSNQLPGVFTFERSYSPSYYNYDTNHIILKWVSPFEDPETKFQEFMDQENDDNYGIERSVYNDWSGYEIYPELVEYYIMNFEKQDEEVKVTYEKITYDFELGRYITTSDTDETTTTK